MYYRIDIENKTIVEKDYSNLIEALPDVKDAIRKQSWESGKDKIECTVFYEKLANSRILEKLRIFTVAYPDLAIVL